MEENSTRELIQSIAHVLTTIGQRTDSSLSEERVANILTSCMQSLNADDSALVLNLATQAVDVFAKGVRPDVTEIRPKELECDVVRFQNNREKWVALVGLLDGYPYEIFTGLADDEEGIYLPKNLTKG